MRCENCRFFENWSTGSKGWCQRYPPHRVQSGNYYFPTVEEEEWCGEFKKKTKIISAQS